MEKGTNLGNDFEPSIDADSSETLHDRGRNFGNVTVAEPECEETKGILKRVARRQSDRSEEGFEVEK